MGRVSPYPLEQLSKAMVGSCVSAGLLTHSDATPSFAILHVQGAVNVTYVYQLVEGEVSQPFLSPQERSHPGFQADLQVKVDKVEYRRPDPPKESTQGASVTSPIPGAW